jgi:hypothetical protein
MVECKGEGRHDLLHGLHSPLKKALYRASLFSSAPRARAPGSLRDGAACDAYGGDAPRDDPNLGRDDRNHDALDGPDRQHEPRFQKRLPRESSEIMSAFA